MTTPTNWPNSERPGVPLFPERGGYHWLAGRYCPDRWRIAIWDAHNGVWIDENGYPDLYVAYKCVYGGPAMNPTQIAEMLAGERERAAQEATLIGESWNGTELSPTNTARHIAHAIRNLGDTP